MNSTSSRLASVFLLAAALTFAQDRGTITGNVTDNSGAVVSTAKITLQSPATGFTQTALSSTDGSYSFLYLASGKYTLTAERERDSAMPTNPQTNQPRNIEFSLRFAY